MLTDNEKQARRDVAKRIKLFEKKVFPQFPESGAGFLMFSIVLQAVRDAYDDTVYPHEQRSGYAYLNSDMPHAQMAGVDPDWIRFVLKKIGLPLTKPEPEYVDMGVFVNAG